LKKVSNFGLVQSDELAAGGVLRPPHLRRPSAAQPGVRRSVRLLELVMPKFVGAMRARDL
jgi:hypothetical protein